MLSKLLKNKELILGSGSPRRKELLAGLNIPFTVKVKSVDESYPSNFKKQEITNFLAELKATAFKGELSKNEILITADTIVWFNNKPVEKPKTIDEAKIMLTQLSGHSHQVFTSVCIKSAEKQLLFYDETVVFFKQLSIEEIDFYVSKFKPLDKAGAYGIQDWIGLIGVEKIVGSYFNVMGLPVHKLYEELLKF